MPDVLTDTEIQSLRAHLGFGNIGPHGAPYTPDGWHEIFSGIISPNLQTATETTSSTVVTAGTSTAITVADATDIVAHAQLVIDVGDDAEIVVVKNVTGLAVTARFAKAHSGTYPVALMCGLTRLRILLHAADNALSKLLGSSMTANAGIKRVEGDVEFFEPQGGKPAKLVGTRAHYESIVWEISSLVRVEPAWARARGARRTVEAY